MIIASRTTWRGQIVPPVVIDDEHAHLLEGRSVFRQGEYPAVAFNSRPMRLHRFLWRQVHGHCPALLDHINGDKWDNRLCNLRAATKSLNSLNRRISKASRLPPGVHLEPRGKARPYYAMITHQGRRRYLGYYATPEEASAAYESARSEYMTMEVAHAAPAAAEPQAE